MTNEILLVMVYNSEYEEEDAILATFDENKANAYIESCKQEDVKFQENYNKMCEAEFAYDEANPYPRADPDYMMEIYPRWDTGLAAHQITDAMRNAREVIQARNKVRQEAYSKLIDEWREKKQTHLREFLAGLGVNPDVYLDALTHCDDHSRRSYKIKKVMFA